MAEEPELIHSEEPPQPTKHVANKAEAAMVGQLMTVMQQTFAPWRASMLEQGASPNSDMLLATAVATFAGAIVGELQGMGLLSEKTLEEVLDALRPNMEAGAAMGRKHVARCADEFLKEEARQQGTERKQ